MTEDPASHDGTLDEALAPFFDWQSAKAWTGLSNEELRAEVDRRAVLSLMTGDGERWFPGRQWPAEERSRVPRIEEMVAAMDPFNKDPAGVALWALEPDPELFEGRTPVEVLRRADAEEVVLLLTVARQIGSSWYQ